MLDIYETSPEKRQFLSDLVQEIPGSTSAAQRDRLMAAFRRYAISTAEAQRWLGVYDPPARVFELRHREGHDIATCWWSGESEAGTTHRVGLYTLIRESKPEEVPHD